MAFDASLQQIRRGAFATFFKPGMLFVMIKPYD
jgi:hypothetical protein